MRARRRSTAVLQLVVLHGGTHHGEGFFLLSFGVVDIDKAVAALSARDRDMKIGAVRAGVGHWRVADLPTDATLGVQIQLTEDPGIDGDER